MLIVSMPMILIGCRDYYNDTIDWTESIEAGTDIRIVKENQPEFVTVDWKNPQSFGNQTQYLISEIKGSKDILNMDNYLVFVNNKYDGRMSYK